MGRYKGDISVHTITLDGSNFDCTIDNKQFKITMDNTCHYFVHNPSSSCNFEDFITEKFEISTQELVNIYDANGKEFRSSPSGTHISVAYCLLTDTYCYLLSILRKLMTECIDVEVIHPNNIQFASILNKCGLTTIPYGDHCLLYPDLEAFRDEQTYDYEDIVDTEEPCVNIRINRKKRLTLDFH